MTRLELADYRRAVASNYLTPATGDPAADRLAWARRRDELFARHPQSSLTPGQRSAFTGIDYFPYDERFRVPAEVEPVTGGEPLLIDTGGEDGRIECEQAALLRSPLGTLTLFWIRGYGGGLFLPFRDGTSAGATYGGGRYLADTIKGTWGRGLVLDGGTATLDFNYAYNPSCAYNSHYACPLAPRSNHLEPAIEAGERVFEGAV